VKPLNLPGRPGASASIEDKVAWLLNAVDSIVRASQVDALLIAQAYTVTNPPSSPVRTLNPSTATATSVANVLAALLVDLQKRGPQSGIG